MIKDNDTLFIYITIMIIIIFYFSKQNINAGIILGVILAYLFYIHINRIYEDKITSIENNRKNKLNYIQPQINYSSKDNNMIDFLFSIQDLYEYNPRVYEEIVKTIEDFYNIYDETILNNVHNGHEYNLLVTKKRDSLNELSSLIISLPAYKSVDDKLKDALLKLEDILNDKLDHIYSLYQQKIKENGMNINTTNIDLGPLPFNTHENLFDPNIPYDDEIY